ERRLDVAEAALRGLEAGAGRAAGPGGAPGVEPRSVSCEELRGDSGRQAVEQREQLADLRLVVEVERRLERLDERELRRPVRRPDLRPDRDAPLGGRERLLGPAVCTQDPGAEQRDRADDLRVLARPRRLPGDGVADALELAPLAADHEQA